MDPGRLTTEVSEHLQDTSNELWLSPISVWETLLLAEKGRIELRGRPSRWIDEVTRAFPVRDALLTREIALISRSIKLPHEDPADRFIAATAVAYKLALVTADERLQEPNGYRVLANPRT